MLSDSGVSFRRLGDIANPWRVRQGSTHVPKLSILIAARDEALLESSLVSVLQNRPPDCEIIVVNDEGYQDPYGLAGEVRFVPTPADTSELDRLNRGVRCCQSPLVHILRCGAEVTEGWTQPAVAHFADARVAAVGSLLLMPGGRYVAAGGVEYHSRGVRIACHHGRPVQEIDAAATVLGPALGAAFYRTSALTLMREPFFAAVGSELADVDLALRLSRAGYRAMFEPRSRVIDAPAPTGASPLADAWLAERLYWRHAKHHGGVRSLPGHAGLIAAEFAACVARPLRAGCLLGRAAGCFERILFGDLGRAPKAPSLEPVTAVRDHADLRVDPAAIGGGLPKRTRRHSSPKVA